MRNTTISVDFNIFIYIEMVVISKIIVSSKVKPCKYDTRFSGCFVGYRTKPTESRMSGNVVPDLIKSQLVEKTTPESKFRIVLL